MNKNDKWLSQQGHKDMTPQNIYTLTLFSMKYVVDKTVVLQQVNSHMYSISPFSLLYATTQNISNMLRTLGTALKSMFTLQHKQRQCNKDAINDYSIIITTIVVSELFEGFCFCLKLIHDFHKRLLNRDGVQT